MHHLGQVNCIRACEIITKIWKPKCESLMPIVYWYDGKMVCHPLWNTTSATNGLNNRQLKTSLFGEWKLKAQCSVTVLIHSALLGNFGRCAPSKDYPGLEQPRAAFYCNQYMRVQWCSCRVCTPTTHIALLLRMLTMLIHLPSPSRSSTMHGVAAGLDIVKYNSNLTI